MQRLAKQEDISLARCIGCVTRCRLISKEASDQKNMSRPTFPHVVCKHVRKFGQSKHVQLQHAERFLERLIDETSIKPKTGIVNQDVDGQPTRIKSGFQLSTGGRLCKIQSLDNNVHTMLLAKLLGQSLHRFPATRH